VNIGEHPRISCTRLRITRLGVRIPSGAPSFSRHVRELKGTVQAPKSVHLLDALPTTAVGKIDKKALRTGLTPGGGL
jgi:hypothetical protein